MFNPFKKKETFSLNDYELPKANSNELNSNNLGQNLDQPKQNNEIDYSSEKYSAPNTYSVPVSPFSMGQQQQLNMQNQDNNSSHQSLHNDLTKAKLDSIDSRVTLIDARLNNIEQKLELLTKLIYEEVSEDTKRKLKVQSMMKNIKE